MAYAASSTVTPVKPGHYLLDIDESDVGVTDFTSVNGLPVIGSIMRVESSLESGTGTTVAPITASADTFAGRDVITAATAAAVVDENLVEGIPYALTDGKFYHQATPDAGTDNVIKTRYLIRDCWSL
jgi:hypothetical protein